MNPSEKRLISLPPGIIIFKGRFNLSKKFIVLVLGGLARKRFAKIEILLN
jgi:hypothetical protein